MNGIFKSRGNSAYHNLGCAGSLQQIGFGHSRKTFMEDARDRVQPHYSLVYVIAGTGTFVNDHGREFRISPGWIFQRYPDRAHSLYLDPNCGWSEAFIALGKTWFDSMKELHALDSTNQVAFLGIDSELPAHIQALRSRLDGCARTDLVPIVLETVALVCNTVRQTMESASNASAIPPRIERACHLLSRDLEERIDIRDFCDRNNWGYEAFRKQFVRETGLSPRQYRIRRRLDAACRMLMDRDMPIGEIADALGYASSQAFSAQFKKYMGTPPRRFAR